MQLEESFEMPSEIREGWGISRDWNRPHIMYISDGSSTIFECDLTNKFKILKTHEVG